MRNRKKNQAPQITEEDKQRKQVRFLSILGSVERLLKWTTGALAVVACFYFTFGFPVQVGRGETTTISVVQNLVANLQAHVVVSWLVTAGAVGYGLNERRLRRKERSEKDVRIAKLEQAIDPGRTSSGVNQSGDPSQGTES